MRFAVGRFASAMGATTVSVSIGYELYERTHTPFALGLVGLVELIPVVLLSLPAGVVSDRFRRRDVAIVAHLGLAACALALAALTLFDGPVSWYYAVLFFLGVATAFRFPAVGPMVPQLVPPEAFATANAVVSSGYELASMVGPALAGFVIATSGGHSTWALAFAAVAHFIFVGILASLPAVEPASRAGQVQSFDDMLAGLRFVRRVRVYLAAITLDLFAVLLGGATALLPIFAKDLLQVGPTGLGWLRAAPAIGAVSMAVLQTRLPAWKRPGQVLLIAVAGFGLATVGFGLSRTYWFSLLMLLLTGLFDNVSVVIRSTLEQSLTPNAMRGRVSAVNAVFIGMSNELGSFESGTAAQLLGVAPSVVAGGVGTLLVVAAVAWVFPELRGVAPLHTLRPVTVETDTAPLAAREA